MVAPICRSGVITRSIGRLESDESPTRRVSNFWPASKPASSRMVVAEFPQLMSPAGGLRTRFLPCTIIVFGSGSSIRIPSALNASTVRIQSFALRNPSRRQTPLESAAIIAARCEMLLSPGTVISVSMWDARFTRSSMFCLFSLDSAPSDALRQKHPLKDAVVQRAAGRQLFVYGSFTSVPGGKPRTST